MTGLVRGDCSLVPLPAASGGGGGGAAAFLPLGIRPPRPCCGSSNCRLGFAALDISSCMRARGHKIVRHAIYI